MAFLQCPRCGGPVHEVFFGDEVHHWRCMGCERIFNEPEWQLVGDELIRVWSP